MESAQTQPPLTEDEINQLVMDHHGWTESIARSVARAWNMDWQMDGLDGAAMEALLFCARRFDPRRGVPFKGYARKRIHEAASDAARKCKTWQRAVGGASEGEQESREIAMELLSVFPELRLGQLPEAGESESDMRGAIRQLLVSATVVAAKQGLSQAGPDQALDYKRLLEAVAKLEPVHQSLIWKVYWEGLSLRAAAVEWETDELNVIREHKALLEYLTKFFTTGKAPARPKVRPGLKSIGIQLQKENPAGIFSTMLKPSA